MESFNKVVDHFGASFDKKSLNGVTYYQLAGEREKDDVRPAPCFAIWHGWVIGCDRPGIMEHFLSVGDEAPNPLASALDFKLIASKVGQQPGGDRPAVFTFSRPDEAWKYLYDLAASQATRDMLNQRATASPNNPFFGALNQGLQQNPLPPWEAISKYLCRREQWSSKNRPAFTTCAFRCGGNNVRGVPEEKRTLIGTNLR